jgi:uncharacterized Rossmann fold enzyme
VDFWEWEPYYRQILADFGFDRRRDEEAAHRLARLLPAEGPGPAALRELLSGKVVTVLGNAPQLESELVHVEGMVIAADEAVSVALCADVVPHIVVTDLDGRIEDLLEATRLGSKAVIHAHGDNMRAIEIWASEFPASSIGTTQSRPFAHIHNFGGFTDGDRAAFLAEHFGAREIRLIGFDFENPNPKDQPADVKRRKLAWARRLIGVLEERSIILFPASASSE